MTSSDHSYRRARIAIVSHHDDLHAHAAKKAVEAGGDVECHIIGCDSLSHFGGLSWQPDGPQRVSTLPTVHGRMIDISSIHVLWFRRCFTPQILPDDITEAAHREIVNEHSSGALLGVLTSSFRGRWISDPIATRNAEHKFLQLCAARDVGMAMPRTLVSNDPKSIRQFCSSLQNRVIVKPLMTSRRAAIFAQKISPEHLISDECLRMCPAIYQEYIPGDRHLRVHIFGDTVLTMLMETEDLDWRINLDFSCRIFDLDRSTEARLRQVLRILKLRMGVFDLKLNGTIPTWLEVNPQGQFLFSEALAGLPLNDAMSKFLCREAMEVIGNQARADAAGLTGGTGATE